MFAEPTLIEGLPPPQVVRDRLGDALREVELLRGLLRIAEKAAEYRECDRDALIRTVNGFERWPPHKGQGVRHEQ